MVAALAEDQRDCFTSGGDKEFTICKPSSKGSYILMASMGTRTHRNIHIILHLKKDSVFLIMCMCICLCT